MRSLGFLSGLRFALRRGAASAAVFWVLLFGLAKAEDCLHSGAVPVARPSSGQVLSEERAVSLALAADARLRAQRERVDAAAGGVQAQTRLVNPVLDIGTSAGGNGVGSRDEDIIVSQTFDTSGQRKLRRLAALRMLDSAHSDYSMAVNDLVREVRLAYVEAQAAVGQRDLGRESAERANRVKELVSRQVARGAAAQTALTRAEIELLRVRQATRRSELAAGLATVELASLLGQRHGGSFALEPLDACAAPPRPGELDALQAEAKRRRPDLSSLAESVRAQEQEVRAIGARRRPDLMVAARRAKLFDSEADVGVRAGFIVPLFDYGSIAGEERQARGVAAERRASLEALERKVDAQVALSYEKDLSARQALQSYEGSVLARSSELLEKTRQGYESGLYSLLELIDAEGAMNQTRLGYISAQAELRNAAIELAWALGRYAPAEADRASKEKKP
ncbi:MAG: TolC family protein [Candidatus Wallbacteria bacterium]|nr:TolC family protein [Candidatus Wallbacteria bacterium]